MNRFHTILRINFFLFYFLCSQIDCMALNPENRSMSQIGEKESELNLLEQRLEELRKKALNDEMEAQPLMFDNWHQYAEKVKKMEEDQKQILELKKKIETLQKSRNFGKSHAAS